MCCIFCIISSIFPHLPPFPPEITSFLQGHLHRVIIFFLLAYIWNMNKRKTSMAEMHKGNFIWALCCQSSVEKKHSYFLSFTWEGNPFQQIWKDNSNMPFPHFFPPDATCNDWAKWSKRGPVTVTQIHWCSVKRVASHVRLLLHWLAAELRLPWQQAAGRQRSESQEDGVGGTSAFDHSKRLAWSKTLKILHVC